MFTRLKTTRDRILALDLELEPMIKGALISLNQQDLSEKEEISSTFSLLLLDTMHSKIVLAMDGSNSENDNDEVILDFPLPISLRLGELLTATIASVEKGIHNAPRISNMSKSESKRLLNELIEDYQNTQEFEIPNEELLKIEIY